MAKKKETKKREKKAEVLTEVPTCKVCHHAYGYCWPLGADRHPGSCRCDLIPEHLVPTFKEACRDFEPRTGDDPEIPASVTVQISPLKEGITVPVKEVPIHYYNPETAQWEVKWFTSEEIQVKRLEAKQRAAERREDRRKRSEQAQKETDQNNKDMEMTIGEAIRSVMKDLREDVPEDLFPEAEASVRESVRDSDEMEASSEKAPWEDMPEFTEDELAAMKGGDAPKGPEGEDKENVDAMKDELALVEAGTKGNLWTGYFATYAKKAPDCFAVAICNTVPAGVRADTTWKGVIPDWDSCVEPYKKGLITEDMYEERYLHQLDMNGEAILKGVDALLSHAEKMGRRLVLLCYEKPSDFCHRHILARWLERRGFRVKELE